MPVNDQINGLPVLPLLPPSVSSPYTHGVLGCAVDTGNTSGLNVIPPDADLSADQFKISRLGSGNLYDHLDNEIGGGDSFSLITGLRGLVNREFSVLGLTDATLEIISKLSGIADSVETAVLFPVVCPTPLIVSNSQYQTQAPKTLPLATYASAEVGSGTSFNAGDPTKVWSPDLGYAQVTNLADTATTKGLQVSVTERTLLTGNKTVSVVFRISAIAYSGSPDSIAVSLYDPVTTATYPLGNLGTNSNYVGEYTWEVPDADAISVSAEIGGGTWQPEIRFTNNTGVTVNMLVTHAAPVRVNYADLDPSLDLSKAYPLDVNITAFDDGGAGVEINNPANIDYRPWGAGAIYADVTLDDDDEAFLHITRADESSLAGKFLLGVRFTIKYFTDGNSVDGVEVSIGDITEGPDPIYAGNLQGEQGTMTFEMPLGAVNGPDGFAKALQYSGEGSTLRMKFHKVGSGTAELRITHVFVEYLVVDGPFPGLSFAYGLGDASCNIASDATGLATHHQWRPGSAILNVGGDEPGDEQFLTVGDHSSVTPSMDGSFHGLTCFSFRYASDDSGTDEGASCVVPCFLHYLAPSLGILPTLTVGTPENLTIDIGTVDANDTSDILVTLTFNPTKFTITQSDDTPIASGVGFVVTPSGESLGHVKVEAKLGMTDQPIDVTVAKYGDEENSVSDSTRALVTAEATPGGPGDFGDYPGRDFAYPGRFFSPTK